MREKLIAAFEQLRAMEAQKRVKEMSDVELEAMIAASLGLPPGTKFSDEQLKMILRSQKIY